MSGNLQPGTMGNEFLSALLANENFLKSVAGEIGPLMKADTISQATNCLRYWNRSGAP